MSVIEVATVKVRPDNRFHENGDGTYNCIAHYEHPSEGEIWVSIGAGETPGGAQDDLRSLLETEGVETPIELVECLDAEKRNRLIWSTKQRAMKAGVAIVVVEE